MPASLMASPVIGPVRNRSTKAFGIDGSLATSRSTFFALLGIIRSLALVMPRTQNYRQAQEAPHNRPQPRSLLGHVLVPAPPQAFVDLPQPRHLPVAPRMPGQLEAAPPPA